MTFDFNFWYTIAAILLCICLLGWTAQSVWRLVDHTRSSGAHTSQDRHWWLRHPWRDRRARSVLLRASALLAALLALFFSPVWRPPTPTAETSNEGAVKQIKATPPMPTKQQTDQKVKRYDVQLHKDNQKAVDSPGIHYEPEKIDPEQHINDILRRTNKRKDTK